LRVFATHALSERTTLRDMLSENVKYKLRLEAEKIKHGRNSLNFQLSSESTYNA